MNEITIPDIMTGSTRIEIKCENWPSYQSYGVFCSATLSHDDDSLLVLFDVVEPEVKADCWDYNQHVCNDSCVELFLQNPALGPDYVNFEFSASGYCLVAKGPDREHRTKFPIAMLKDLEIKVSGRDGGWRLYACIPLKSFGLSSSNEFSSLELNGNLYKCGDGLRHPHYLSWLEISTPGPDFHRPEYFGKIIIS